MTEKRRFDRLPKDLEKTTSVLCDGVKNDVKVIDVSVGGMCISVPRQVPLGAELYSKIHVDPNIGPFFIRGTVTRVAPAGENWVTAVKFEKVSTLPFMIMNMYQMA